MFIKLWDNYFINTRFIATIYYENESIIISHPGECKTIMISLNDLLDGDEVIRLYDSAYLKYHVGSDIFTNIQKLVNSLEEA
jgi:hypothetical protein